MSRSGRSRWKKATGWNDGGAGSAPVLGQAVVTAKASGAPGWAVDAAARDIEAEEHRG